MCSENIWDLQLKDWLSHLALPSDGRVETCNLLISPRYNSFVLTWEWYCIHYRTMKIEQIKFLLDICGKLMSTASGICDKNEAFMSDITTSQIFMRMKPHQVCLRSQGSCHTCFCSNALAHVISPAVTVHCSSSWEPYLSSCVEGWFQVLSKLLWCYRVSFHSHCDAESPV